jgi:hypothetical protein
MTDPTRDLHTIETFAALCARLDDGFAVRATVLAAAGLDDAGWHRTRAAWLARLAVGDAPELASRFAQTYAHARQHPEALSLPVAPPTPPPDLPAWVDDEQTAPDASPPDASPVPEPEPDCTAGIALPHVGPALPFRVPPLLPPALAIGPVPSYLPELPEADGNEATMEVPFSPPPPPHTVLPFGLPINGRRQRLVRYDTATGQPLAQPYWIDDPTPPLAC